MGKITASAALAASLAALREDPRGPKGQRAFGQKAGIGENTVGRARSGLGNITLENLDAIAAVYKLPAWKLLVPGFNAKAPPVLAGGADVAVSQPASEVAGPNDTEEIWEALSMQYKREIKELFEAWHALPENLRDDFKRDIELAAMQYRRRKRDHEVSHLAAPKDQQELPPAVSKPTRGGKGTN
jgi:transcriptional regulator with XRE-family HTH domain